MPTAPKASLLDIQEKQQRTTSPPLAQAPQTPAAPAAKPTQAAEDDFWGAGTAKADAMADDSQFPALDGGASKASSKKSSSQQAAKKSNQSSNWTGGVATSGGGRGQQRPSAPTPKAAPASKQATNAKVAPASKQQAKGAVNAGSGKKKMQKLDPSLLGFSSNLQARIAQGQVLPVDQ